MGYVLLAILLVPALAAALLVLGIATGLFRERTAAEQAAHLYRASWRAAQPQ